MPDPKTNAEGKVYPWAIEQYDYGTYKSLMFYGIQMSDNALMLGKEKQNKITDLYSHMTQTIVTDPETEDTYTADTKVMENVFGANISINRGTPTISVSIGGEDTKGFYLPDQIPKATKDYNEIKGIQQEVSENLRKKYEGKTDSTSRMLDTYAKDYADLMDLQSVNADPQAGSIMKAFYDAPYLNQLKAQQGGTPRFGTRGFEECVKIMNPESGKSIYDDYMTMMGAGEREQKIQFDRQKMEQEGPWNAEKEESYLSALRSEHQKNIEAFDRLWEVDDKGQYDDALNNHLDHMVGKKISNKRDCNGGIGYMRGEVQAIDLGYDSKHLYILGQVGMREQMLKKHESEISIQIADKEKELQDLAKASDVKEDKIEKTQKELKGLRDQMDHLNEYKKDFSELKEGIWGKKVSSKEEMEAVEKQTEEFFRQHNEKYEDLQKTGIPKSDIMIGYQKEEAQKSTPVREVSQRDSVMDSDLETVRESVMSGNKIIANQVPEMSAITSFMPYFTSRERQNEMIERTGDLIVRSSLPDNRNPDYTLSESFEKECKEFMADVAVDIKKGLEENRDNRYPRAESLRSEIANTSVRYMDTILKGTPNTSEYGKVSTLMPQLNGDMFRPENIERTDQILKDYPLDEYIRKGLAIDKMQREYSKREAGLSQQEKGVYQEAIREMQDDFLDLAKDLHEKSLNPSPEILSLFGEEKYLMSKANGFIGDRGLESLIEGYEKDFAKTPIADQQLSALDTALDKFNTKRNFFAGKESPEHAALREGVENLKNDLKELQSGMVDDGKGKQRPMTAEEKLDKLTDVLDQMNSLSDATDDYIKHSLKNGKAPSTGAGASRLEGAKEIKDMLNDLQETLSKEQSLEVKRQMRRETRELQKQETIKANAEPAPKEPAKEEQKQDNRRRMSLNDMMKDEKKNQPQKPKHERVSVPVQQNTVQTERTKGK